MLDPNVFVDSYNKWHKVPNLFPRIKIGDKVTWRVEAKRKNGPKPFETSGVVINIYSTIFGGRSRKMAAKVETGKEYLKVYPNRRYTAVALDKLKLEV